MSDLDRILKLAGQAHQSPAPAVEVATTEREMKPVAQEAVGEFADPILDLCDDLGCDSDHPVLDELIRYLDGDTIKDFVADFRRHNDMNHPGEDGDYGDDDQNFGEAEIEEAKGVCKDCGCEIDNCKPGCDCPHDSHDASGDHWVAEAKAKPDFLDVDKDGDKDEPMKKAIKDKKVDEAEEADTDTEELEEAQSQAQKDAFAKMLASKKGAKKDDKEELEESPTMDTTQLINLMKNSGLSEEKIKTKLDEWANTPAGAAEEEATSHGEPYENFAQSVNLSLKRYLDAEDMKVGLKEHKVEDIKEAYKRSKGKK
jgi:hypothetical protein